MSTNSKNGAVVKQKPLLDVKASIELYKHLLKEKPNFGTDVFDKNYVSEGIVLIEDESIHSKGVATRFDCYALILRIKGDSIRSVDQHLYEVKPLSLQLINPGSLFSFEDTSDYAKSFVLLFDSNFIKEDNLSLERGEKLCSFHQKHCENVQLDATLYAQVLDIYEHINAEFRIKNSGYVNLIKMYINQLLYMLQREKKKLHVETKYTKSEQISAEFLSLIEEYFQTKKKVYEYADMLNITANHLSEIVQNTLHVSALSFIHKRILKEAEYLLCYSELSIKQITSELNFESSSQFGRFFKHNRNLSPKAFRLKMVP